MATMSGFAAGFCLASALAFWMRWGRRSFFAWANFVLGIINLACLIVSP